MKPIKITISAFGSFANAQTVDFARLGESGLYLITGDTGAGKTTIFDAISFALYGKASGDGRGDYQMLRSDFADDKTKTFVELDFVSGDSLYNIKRVIKKNGQDVALVLPEGTSISGDRNVKSKIAEIVGLDREQFAQIMMIAQNDFLRFLQSGTEDRLKILRQIFGTESLKAFQERLKSLAKQEADKRAKILYDFQRYGLDVYRRDAQFTEWEVQIKADKAGLSEVNDQLGAYDQKKQALAAEIAVAEDLDKKFSDLAKRRADLQVHAGRAAEISGAEKRALRGETALRKVKPLADEAQKASVNHVSAQIGLKNAAEGEAAAIAALEKAVRAVADLPPLDEAREAFAVLSKEWETAAGKLEGLAALQKGRADIAGKQVALAKAQTELAAALGALENLPAIADLQAELDKTAAELKDEEDKLAKFTALQSDYQAIAGKQAVLAEEQNVYETINAGFNDANAIYTRLEEAFLRGQAGILARGLADGEPCPVCGSADHPAPAPYSDEDVSETKLRKAREAKDKAQLKREGKASSCGALKSEIDTLIKRFIADLSGSVPGATIESAPALLREAIGGARSSASALAGKKTAGEKSLADLKAEIDGATKKRDELAPRAASLQSEIDTLTKRFLSDLSPYVPDVEWAPSERALTGLYAQTKTALNELSAQKETEREALEDLSAYWDEAAERKATAESAAAAARTLKAERAANEQRLSGINDEARTAYAAALSENNFADETEYITSLIAEKELSELRKQISDYEKSGEQLNRDAARLEGETAGKAPPDVGRLLGEAETLRIESNALNGKRDEINNRLTKNEAALRELSRAAADFEKTEKSYAAVKQLADTANGKVDFETYAQAAYFGRVLRAANLRLQLMSQNRYALLRKTDSDDGRRRSGLELEVFDAYTGKARSANSLSGGESFMASLSLALGLSDVVQQNTGGVRLDAMFIDEGFGSLDTEVLELAIRTLSEMAGTNRIIGIISHVTELRERIDKQIRVEKTIAGSRISVAV